MKLDIFIVSSRPISGSNNPQSVYLKSGDWVFWCENCVTWEVLELTSEELNCWCCGDPYTKYEMGH